MQYAYTYDIAAFIIFLCQFIYFFVRRKTNTRRSGVFLIMLAMAIVTTSFDLLTFIAAKTDCVFPTWLRYGVTIGYYCCLGTGLLFYLIYTVTIADNWEKLKIPLKAAILVPYAAQILFTISSAFTGLAFSYNQSAGLVKGPASQYSYGFALYMLIFAAVFSLKYINLIPRKRILAHVAVVLVVLVASVLQAFFPMVKIVLFSFSLCSYVILVTLQNPAYVLDYDTKTNNRNSFNETTAISLSVKKQFVLIAVVMDNYWAVSRSVGIRQSNLLLTEIAVFLKGLNAAETVYRLDADMFVVRLNENVAEGEKSASEIINRFDHPWNIDALSAVVNARLCIIDCPKDANNLSDLQNTVVYFKKRVKNGSVVRAENLYEQLKTRRASIERAIRLGFDDGGFRLWFRPSVSAKSGRITALSASLRLCDKVHGDIPPGEMISIAEQTGQILTLDLEVFERVCDFISRSRLWELGIKDIEIHLSAVQCMQYNICETLLEIMRKYAVPPKIISFSVTESNGEISPQLLLHSISLLSDKGAKLSLDDYGKGYTDISCLFDCTIDMIRIDKHVIADAAKSEKAYIALENTVHMFKELGIKTTIQGITDESLYNLASKLGCDYYQGDFFSSNVGTKQLIELLQSDVTYII